MTTEAATIRRSQRQRRSESERRCLDAAVELVSQQGVERTGLAQIGDKAGTSRGLPGYLFGSKRELLRHMVIDLQRHWASVIGERSPQGTGVEEITNYVERYFKLLFSPKGRRYLGAMMGIVAAEASGLADAEGVGREINDRLRGTFCRMIEDGLADGSIRRGADARTEAGLIVAQLRGITLDWLIDRQSVLATTQWEAVVAHIRRALEAPG